ncbi:MAG: hypothetical protein UW84_C0056G0003 [Candidatus Collierbacteria bacterium GW2011_GWA2_44_99]|uniref:Uncharacterized protein n=1 Tax=Candidatus Collierbacteria bacterium GW2011_GWA2_44_99 TaxID=1618380 RepID=A0A0G1KLZ6_9BACT|nr:MAG: hypothetical protein UW84_C0056G0003 [Candidatus Collierbacteria bacterium GW2011_GWA2_44_99]
MNRIPRNVVVILILLTLVCISVSCLLALSDPPTSAGAQAAVEDEGYTNVTVSESKFLEARAYCSDNDYFYFAAFYFPISSQKLSLSICVQLALE